MKKTNDDLNDLFTVHLCGLSTVALADAKGRWYKAEDESWAPVPDFCNDLSAVIQWLSSLGCWTATYSGEQFSVGLKNGERITAYGVDGSFEKAAMIACLKAKGVNV